MFVLMLYVSVNNFSIMSRHFPEILELITYASNQNLDEHVQTHKFTALVVPMLHLPTVWK